MASAAHPPHHLTDPTRVTPSFPCSLNAHSPPPRRRIFSASSLIRLPFDLYCGHFCVGANRRRGGARQGGRQPHRRAGGRPRGAAPLRGGRPLEHQHAPTRARGVSTPRREENKRAAPPNGGMLKLLNTEYARLRRTRPAARVATRAHDDHDRGTTVKAVRRGRQYIFTHGTTEKRPDRAVHVYQSWPSPRRAGRTHASLCPAASTRARTPTSIRRDCAHINQERLRAPTSIRRDFPPTGRRDFPNHTRACSRSY